MTKKKELKYSNDRVKFFKLIRNKKFKWNHQHLQIYNFLR